MSANSHLRTLIAQAHDLLRDGSPSGPDGYSGLATDLQGAAGSLMPEFRVLYREDVDEASDLAAQLYAMAERSRLAYAEWDREQGER